MKGNKNKNKAEAGALQKSLISAEDLDSGSNAPDLEFKPDDQADHAPAQVGGFAVVSEQEETKQDEYDYFTDEGVTIEYDPSGPGSKLDAKDDSQGDSQDHMFPNIDYDLEQSLVQVNNNNNNLNKLKEACGYIYNNLSIKNTVICTLSSHVAFMYYLLTEYSGKQIMDKDDGLELLTELSPKWQRSVKDSFIILTVFANFALSIYSLNRVFATSVANPGAPDAKRKKSYISSILASKSSVVLALLFVASCEESIKSYKSDYPDLNDLFKLDMKFATLSVLVVYTLLFYPDLQPAYANIGSAVRDSVKLRVCDIYKDLRNSYRDFLIKQRVEYVYKKIAMRIKNTEDSSFLDVGADKLSSQLQVLRDNSNNVCALMCHRSIFFHHLAAGILSYFDVGLLLGSVASIKNGISELINMFSGLEANLDGEAGKYLEYLIFSMVLVAVPVFVNFGVQGSRVGALFVGNISNKKALAFGLSMLASTVILPRIFSEITSNNVLQLLLSVLTMGAMQVAAEYGNLESKGVLRQHVGMMLVLLSGMAFFATTYISELAARKASAAAENHPFDQAGADLFSPFHPFLVAFVGFMMAGAFNTNPFDIALHGELNGATDQLIAAEIEAIHDFIEKSNNLAVQGAVQNPLSIEAETGGDGAGADLGLSITGVQGSGDTLDRGPSGDGAFSLRNSMVQQHSENGVAISRVEGIINSFKNYHANFQPASEVTKQDQSNVVIDPNEPAVL